MNPASGFDASDYDLAVPLILLVIMIFYFLILRPQQKRQRDHAKMLEELAKGDRIVTNGGLYATILNVKDNVLVATIAEGVKVELARNAIANKVSNGKK